MRKFTKVCVLNYFIKKILAFGKIKANPYQNYEFIKYLKIRPVFLGDFNGGENPLGYSENFKKLEKSRFWKNKSKSNLDTVS